MGKNLGRAGLGERQPVAGETEPAKHLFQQVERATLRRRHAGAADQLPCKIEGKSANNQWI